MSGESEPIKEDRKMKRNKRQQSMTKADHAAGRVGKEKERQNRNKIGM